jgi:hypothetical protein
MWHVDIAVTSARDSLLEERNVNVMGLFLDKQGDKHWSELSTLI